MERTILFLNRLRTIFNIENSPTANESYHYVVRYLSDKQLEAAEHRLTLEAASNNGYAPRLTPGDVKRHAESAIPTTRKGLNPNLCVFGKDEEMRELAWHPGMRTPEGEQYPQLAREEVARAHPKLTGGGKEAAMVAINEFLTRMVK